MKFVPRDWFCLFCGIPIGAALVGAGVEIVGIPIKLVVLILFGAGALGAFVMRADQREKT